MSLFRTRQMPWMDAAGKSSGTTSHAFNPRAHLIVIHSQYLRLRELTHPFAPCFQILLHHPAYQHVARSGQYVSISQRTIQMEQNIIPSQTARVTLLALPLIRRMSMFTWRTIFVSVPRGPVTTMTRDLTETVTPSGITSSSVLRISRIYGIS